MATTESGPGTVLVITRKLAAPRERVFRAWTEPEELKRWWGAGDGFTTPIAEVDLRVGGRDVQRPSRLVYTWAWEGSEGPETLVTVEFRDLGQSTGSANA